MQLAYGWNNSQLQSNASGLDFSYSETEVAETTWTCDRDAGPQTQERANTTTTTTQGVVDVVERDNKRQVTGFTLTGFAGGATTTSSHEGPAVGSCPTYWTAINVVAGDPVVTESGLYVIHNGAKRLLQ